MTAKKSKKSGAKDLKPKTVRKSTATKVRGGSITRKVDAASPTFFPNASSGKTVAAKLE